MPDLVLFTTLLYDLPLDTVQNKEVETYLVSEPHYQRTQRGYFINKYSMNRLQLQWANYIYNQTVLKLYLQMYIYLIGGINV